MCEDAVLLATPCPSASSANRHDENEGEHRQRCLPGV